MCWCGRKCPTVPGKSRQIPARIRSSVFAWLELQAAGVDDTGLGAVGRLDATDQVELFAAAAKFRFDLRDMSCGHNQNHSHSQIECLQKLVAVNPADSREVAEDGEDWPRAEFDRRLHVAGGRGGGVSGDAA